MEPIPVSAEDRKVVVENIRDHRPYDKAFWGEVLPGMHPMTIARVAREEGVDVAAYGAQWTEEEIATLRENVHKHPSFSDPFWAEALPRRSARAIRDKAWMVADDERNRDHVPWTAGEERKTLVVLERLAESLDRTPDKVAWHTAMLVRKLRKERKENV